MNTSESSNQLIPMESKSLTIQKCFKDCLYEVPNFQRPYSWTEDQLNDFWNDVVLAEGDFFFGSTVTWLSQERDLFNNTYSLIDGQQRLTTSAIAISAIRGALNTISKQKDITDECKCDAENQSKNTQRYLVAKDDEGVEYDVIKRPEPEFREIILKPGSIPSSSKEKQGESIKRIRAARGFFDGKISNEIENLDNLDKISTLKRFRNNILKARVIQVELKSEEDGFLVFETLNARGLDLKLSDLVKNLLIRGGANDEEDRKRIASRWDNIVKAVYENHDSNDIMDRFIWQSWNSRRESVKQASIFKHITNFVSRGDGEHIKYLEELEFDASIYRNLEVENISLMGGGERDRNILSIKECVDSIRALAIFDISVANSAILSLARKYSDKKRLITKKQVIETLRMVESFHFKYNMLAAGGSTGGTRKRYNVFSVNLENANSKEEVKDAIRDLCKKLENALPDRSIMINSFCDLFYAPNIRINQSQKRNARKIFIAYILMNFLTYSKSLPKGQELRDWSIEHLKPQSSVGEFGKDSHDNPVYSIGNLILIPDELNGNLANFPLLDKFERMERVVAPFDDKLREWKESGLRDLDRQHIKERAEFLANKAVDEIWKITQGS